MADRLTLVSEAGNTRGTYSYDLAGRRTHLGYGNSSYSDYFYDTRGMLTLVDNRKSDATQLSGFGYMLDAAGIRTKMDIAGSAYTAASIAYAYDHAYELTKETRTGGNAFTESFWYDPSGLRTKKDRRAPDKTPAWPRRADIGIERRKMGALRLHGRGNRRSQSSGARPFGLPRRRASSALRLLDNSYYRVASSRRALNMPRRRDNAAHALFLSSAPGGTATTYSYDALDRLTLAGTTAYQWDDWGNVTKVGTDNTYYWDDADRLTKFDGSGTTNDTEYVYAPGSWERVRRDQGGTVRYFTWDGGNQEAIYTTAGAATWRFLTPQDAPHRIGSPPCARKVDRQECLSYWASSRGGKVSEAPKAL